MCTVHRIDAVTAHADHAPAANGLLNQPLVILKIRPLILGYPRTVSVGSKTCVTEPKRILFKGDEPVHELMRAECFALCVPLVAVGDFDLLFAFALIQIGYYRAQGRARLFSVKRLARHPK